MSYRFVRVTTNYPQYIKDFYLRNPEAKLKSYNDQYVELTQDSIEISSAYVKNLNKIGVKAFEIITNAVHLQNSWKTENNISSNISTQDLAIIQIKSYQPEIVWIDDLEIVDKGWKTKLLKEVPSIKLFIGHHCAPYNDSLIEKLKLFDIMFTCTPGLRNDFEKLGIKSYLMYHGFESSVLDKITEEPKEIDLIFTGSLISGGGFHTSRIEYIESILKSGINITLFGNLEEKKKVLLKKVFYNIIISLRKLGLSSTIESISVLKKNKAFGDSKIHFYSKKLINCAKPPVFGFEMFKTLSKSKVCFNIHGEVAGNCAGNIRLFEATGVGTCLVTDWKENIKDLFEPGKEIITYKTKEECVAKIKWLNDNPNEMERIAKAGQKKTLSFHTIEKRAILLNEILENELIK
jgi:spore maturation protein CgeB